MKNILNTLICSILAASIVYGLFKTDILKLDIDSELCVSNEIINEFDSISNAIDKIYDATILIENLNMDGIINGTGTGFVYKIKDGYAYIVTNHHVVDGASSINIMFSDFEKIESIDLVGSDKYVDIAVLRMKEEYVRIVAVLGDSDKINLGDTVFTVGSPLGERYIGTVTRGILSGKNRSVPVSIDSNSNKDWEMDVLQTDAAINPGNSGGPLLNIMGEVIGINSLKLVLDEVEGMGFAIPINQAKKYINDIEENGVVLRPTLGIGMKNVYDLSIYERTQLDIGIDITRGVVIIEVIDGTPAKKAGLKDNDVIISFENNEVNNIAELRKYLFQKSPYDEVSIGVIRNDVNIMIDVTLDDTPLNY